MPRVYRSPVKETTRKAPLERNNRVFQSSISPPFILMEKVRLHSFLWLKFKQAAFAYGYQDWWKYPILCMGVLL